MLADLIDVRNLLMGLSYIKVETVAEMGFELTTLRSEVLCSTAGPHDPTHFDDAGIGKAQFVNLTFITMLNQILNFLNWITQIPSDFNRGSTMHGSGDDSGETNSNDSEMSEDIRLRV